MLGSFVSCKFDDGELNLEEQLRKLARYCNTYTIAVFECCRVAEFRSEEPAHTGNYKFIFGCGEGGKMSVKNSLSKAILAQVGEDVTK
jgi:hypothetical protein